MKLPVMPKMDANGDIEITDIDNGNAKHFKDTTIYTGNKSKRLLVHIMQKGIEVDKPVKAMIYEQSVTWRGRQYPIVPERFYYDYTGVAHQYVDVNDVSVLTWHKDHEDKCKACGGKMTVDARESRALGRRGIFHAIWGLDNTHIMLMVVLFIGAIAMAGAFFYAYMNDTKHVAQLESANKEIARLNGVLNPVEPQTGHIINEGR